MAWSVTTPPATEPVSLADAKLYFRVDSNDEDDLITELLKAARVHVEEVCERALVTQTWTERQAAFQDVIELRGGVITAVDSVKYTDVAGTEQTLGAGEYVLDRNVEPATLRPVSAWPAGATDIEVQYQVGYPVDSVPAPLLLAIKLIANGMYRDRETTIDGREIDNPTVARLLFPYRRVRP